MLSLLRSREGTPIKTFFQRFGGFVLGILSGFDRLIFKGKLRQLYSPDGMDCYLAANHVMLKEFTAHAQAVSHRVLQASLVEQAKQDNRYRYVNSSQISKEEAAREIAKRQRITEGLVTEAWRDSFCWLWHFVTAEQEPVQL